MDETSGTRNDSHGSNHLTDNNTVSSTLGLQGNAASFVPANLESLTVTDNPNISGGNIGFTLVANVYLNNNTSTFVIMDKSDSVSAYDYRIAHNPGTGFRFRVGADSGYVDSGAVSANTWHTVIAWHDSVNNTINLQVDNGTVNTVPYSAGTTDTTYPLSIGALPDGTYGLDGRIDEAAIYKRVLTSSERAWVYNNGVRRTYADLIAPPPGSPISYTYGDPAHKHAVTALGTVASYTYDANGNMISRAEIGQSYTQTFDTQNRLTAVAVGTQTTQFLYDPDGNLVEKINPAGSTVSKTIYVGGIYEEDKDSSGGILHRRTYYPAAGAMRVDSTLYYVLKDQLGSASVVTDANGVILTSGGEQRYYPYGEKRLTPGITATDKLFTGQRDTGLGIYYYGARFYSPYINRFLSADTIVSGYTNPQNLNRYSYALNNPLRFTDPSGHRPDDGCGTGEGCNVTAQTIIDDNRRANDFRSTTERNKCKAGNKNSCSYAENHPVETATFLVGSLTFIGATDYVFFGGGLTSDTSISLLARLGTHNAESSIVSLGTYDAGGEAGYIQIAKAANNGYTYFQLPKLVYKAAEVLGIGGAANAKFMSNQIQAGKDFAVTIINNRIGTGTAMEIDMIQKSGQYIQTAVNNVFQYFQHIP